MRLKRLFVQNFQSHRKTDLNLHSGINVIFGESNHGKTALLRAFQWVCTNRPLGFRFHSWFAGKKDETKVIIQTDHNTIMRTRHERRKSIYDVDGHKLKGFDKNVPEEVTKALNMSELNVQPQLEPFFLITSSPSEITKTINRITRIEKTDDWIKQLTSRINTCRAEKRVLQSELEVVEQGLEELENLPQIEKRIERAERKVQMIKHLNRERYSLLEFLEKHQAISTILKEVEKFLRSKEKFIRAEKLSERQKELKKESEQLQQYLVLQKDSKRKYSKLEERKAFVEWARKVLKEIEFIENYLSKRQDLLSIVQRNEEESSAALLSIRSLLKNLKQCPVCYSSIQEKDIDRIMERI